MVQTDDAVKPADGAISYAIESVPGLTGITRTRVFNAVKQKELTARKAGRQTIIEADELRRWISTFPTRGREAEAAV